MVSTDALDADDTEDADDPGIVGDSRGWAVNDSCEPLRFRPPCERPIEPGAKRLSRLLGCIFRWYYPQSRDVYAVTIRIWLELGLDENNREQRI